MTLDEYIESYKKTLIIKRFQPNTIETYLSCLKSFLYWCQNADIFPPEITKDQLLDYLSKTKSTALLRQQIGTIGNFYKYVIGIPYICAGIPYPRKNQHLPDYFTPNELIRVFEAVKNDKQRLILKIQYALALRVHEVVKIKWKDFSLKYNTYEMKVIGKGNKYNYLPVPKETIAEIILTLGDHFGIDEYLFKGQSKEHYSERSVQEVINRAMNTCGIIKEGSTHLLRHSRATHLIQNGSSLRHVQKLLRHSKSTTTEIYTHLCTDDLRESFETADVKIQLQLNNQKLLSNEV